VLIHLFICNLLIAYIPCYRGTSSAESGTLFQLRNLIFRRNILKDVTKHMNVVEDFFETVVTCYIVAAAMHFFAMKSSGDVPHANAFPQGIASKSVSERARSFQDKVLQVVDRYVRHNSVEECALNILQNLCGWGREGGTRM